MQQNQTANASITGNELFGKAELTRLDLAQRGARHEESNPEDTLLLQERAKDRNPESCGMGYEGLKLPPPGVTRELTDLNPQAEISRCVRQFGDDDYQSR